MTTPKRLPTVYLGTIIASVLGMLLSVLPLGATGIAQAESVREVIAKSVEARSELSPEKRAQLQLQLSLADFKRGKGQYPQALSELVPEYFDTIPNDPATGKPFPYSVHDGRYSLGDAAQEPPLDSAEVLRAPKSPQGDATMQPAEATPFVYNPAGKRDPFMPFDLQAGPVIDPLNPLTAYDYGQLRLTSVLASSGEPLAIVEDSTGRGYTVRKGTKIGKAGGVVSDIHRDRIVILEETTDFAGAKKTQSIELKLRPAEPTENRGTSRSITR